MEAFLSFLQLENLQNYLQQNKLKAINKTLEVDNSGTKNFLETLSILSYWIMLQKTKHSTLLKK